MLLDWIKNIVLFILFSSLVFFLLPDEKYRKYMQTAVGFVLAVIVLTPVLKTGGLNDVFSFDYYYESVAGAPGDGDVRYYTDVMETMIEDYLRDRLQLDSTVSITFDRDYTIASVEINVLTKEPDAENGTEPDVDRLRQEITKEYQIPEEQITVSVNGYQVK